MDSHAVTDEDSELSETLLISAESGTVGLHQRGGQHDESVDGQLHLVRSGWLDYDEAIPKMSESTKLAFSAPSHPAVRACEFICFIISLGISVYFVSINHLNVALQYTQVCFISAITIVFDSSEWWTQRLWYSITVLVGGMWLAVTIWSGNVDMGYELLHNVVASLTGLFFFGGLLVCIYASMAAPTAVKRVEIDLLLYLISLNAICFFSSDVFNNNLHMILDLRTYVLLFNCMHQPKDKMDLLKSKTLVLIVVLTIAAFLTYIPLSLQADLIGNVLYVVIGMLLVREGVVVLRRHRVSR
jgi:hypothetical protein